MPGLAVALAMVLLLPGAAAQASGDLAVGSAAFAGEQHWSGELLGLRLHSMDLPERGSLAISAPFLHLETVNRTGPSVAYVAVNHQDGGEARDYGPTAVTAAGPQAGVDVVVVPVAGADRPTLLADSAELATVKSPQPMLQEEAYMREDRPRLSSDIGQAVQATTGSHRVRVEGTFAVSVWGWNLTVGDDPVPTGSSREGTVSEPATGGEVVSARTVRQVAQIIVRDGWLEMESDRPLLAYVDDLRVRGLGVAELAGVRGLLAGGESADQGRLRVDGRYQVRQAWTEGSLYTRFESLDGAVTLDGHPVRPLTGSAEARPGNVAADPASGGGSAVGLAGGLAALMVAAVVAHGPVQSLRFRSIQRKFERRDYLEVLVAIDAFTRRRRFRRSANLLKAISLLSLGQFREAALFLGTLRPTDGPDPATQAFLRACAAAGQGQDADALAHLGDCFRLDPSFREEAHAVPALRGLLPYFELDAGAGA